MKLKELKNIVGFRFYKEPVHNITDNKPRGIGSAEMKIDVNSYGFEENTWLITLCYKFLYKINTTFGTTENIQIINEILSDLNLNTEKVNMTFLILI